MLRGLDDLSLLSGLEKVQLLKNVAWALLMRPTKVQVALLLVLSVVEIHLPPTTGSACKNCV